MSEREYIVSLNKGVDYAAFNQEMIAATGSGNIPGRTVDVANHRHASQRNTHYMLTGSEAESLKNDGRVYGVTLKDDPSISIGVNAVQTGDFSKTTLDRGNFLNWGMRRMNESTNPYSGVSVTGGYNYTLDGTGVDVVIQDTGIQKDHPEWQDASGVSRFQEINWYTESGISGTQSANFYRDFHGHGTHVAGTIAGKTYGWAKNARIYAMKVAGLEGSGDTGTGYAIDGGDCFDAIKLWHRNKPVDPATGVKRPTIVNMSWGYGTTFTNITGGNYRGTPWTDTVRQTDKGMIGRPEDFRHVIRVASVDTDVEELIDEGIHIVVAAGNTYQKIDVEGGIDYDNYYTKTGVGNVYYHRGGSPFSPESHVVGNIDSTIHVGGLEQKAASSETGPGVSIYTPGTDIMSAMSTTNIFGATTVNNPYPEDSNFLINNISGTSMAAPQVSGVLALWLQINPGATPAQGLAFINATAKTAQLYQTGLTNDYTDARSLLGGTNRFAFNKFNSNVQMRIGIPTPVVEAGAAATYALSSSSASVNEGSSFTITLTTTNVTNGTTVPYTITGISSADIGGASLTGNFTVNSNTASTTFNVTADATTEGAETFVLTLNALSTTQSVTINDTSTTPVGTPTYAVAPAANNVNEGSALVFNVTTANVADATTLYWTVTNAADFSTSTGSFAISSNAGSFTVTPTADATTEGAETFTASIRTGSVAGTIVATSSAVTINDTSTTPGDPTYAVAPAANNVNEGSALVFNVTTANVADATTLYWSVTNAGDFSTSTGSFAISSNAGSFSVTPTADATTEGAETFTASVRTGSVGGTIVATSSSVTINDTSTTPGGESYSLAASSESITEGENTTFTLTTTNVADATNVAYTITGVSSSDLDNGPRRKTAAKNFEGPGSAFFKREMQVGGVRLVIAGGVGGQTAVPDLFADKVARMFELFTDSAGAGITVGKQNQMIQTLIGATTSYHSNYPTIQRIARGAGGDYTPNFLTDAGISAWGLSPLFDATVQNDMVWYLNSTGGAPGDGDIDAQEVIEHVFHTLHMHGIDAVTLKMYPTLSADWATGDLYNAMAEAFDANKWDPQGYNNPSNAWKTDPDAFEVAVKEYLYLLNFCMFDYSDLWDGGSLAPEWTDDMRTPAGILANNPLGYALFNTHIADVISKPSLVTIRSIFQDGDTGNPVDSGSSGYFPDAAIPLTGSFTVSSNSATLTLNVAKDGVVDVDSLTVTLDNGEATQAVTVADDGVVPGFAPDYALYVTNPGGNEYTLSGYDRNGLVSGAQPTLAYNNGDKVIVTVQGTTSSSHPFYIKTAQGSGTGNQASGVDGQGTVKLEWTIGSTGTFYYQCSIHSSMNNTITVS